jgi:hypothetical protein
MYQEAVHKLRKRRGSASKTIIVLLILVIIGYIVVTVDFINCPVCKDVLLLRNLCRYCNYDGKVTILEYLLYLIR